MFMSIIKLIYEWRSIIAMFIPKSKKVIGLTFDEEAVKFYNEHMELNGSATVQTNEFLSKAAQYHSDWMNSNKKLSHVGIFGKSARQRCTMAGFVGNTVAEHIFLCNTKDPKKAIKLYLESKSAKDDVGERFRLFGVGVSGRYWCIILGR